MSIINDHYWGGGGGGGHSKMILGAYEHSIVAVGKEESILV